MNDSGSKNTIWCVSVAVSLLFQLKGLRTPGFSYRNCTRTCAVLGTLHCLITFNFPVNPVFPDAHSRLCNPIEVVVIVAHRQKSVNIYPG